MVTGLSLVCIFIFRAIKGVLIHTSLSIILSYWFFSMVIGMSIVHSYAEINEPLKLIALFMTIINLIFFGYYANRRDAMGWMAHLFTMVAMSFWVAF